MRSYEAARGLFSFMSFVGWVIIAGGIIAAIAGVSIGSEIGRHGYGRGPGPEVFLFILPGVGIGIVGVITLALAQMGRAGVDTAEYSQQMLQLSRESLDVSRQSLRQSEQMRTSFEALKTVAPAKPTVSYPEHREQPPEPSSAAQVMPASSVTYTSRDPAPSLPQGGERGMLHSPVPTIDPLQLQVPLRADKRT